ncbi:MAG: DUF1559 domain-containing protein, partial [Gemmataceae bacterium]|nr:DUF1559 domain-containing protein [Gemmataceae bacterium]
SCSMPSKVKALSASPSPSIPTVTFPSDSSLSSPLAASFESSLMGTFLSVDDTITTAPIIKRVGIANVCHNKGLTASRSNHSGGVNLLFCDGSVRFAADEINLSICNLSTRAGGEANSNW